MQQMVVIKVIIGLIILLDVGERHQSNGQSDICHFPTRYKYPCEIHSIKTVDGYILSAARIPHSTKGAKKRSNHKSPVVLLMHGLIWSSDCWLLNDPSTGLAYMLSDAGYDVWLGNSRGSKYGKKHISKSSLSPAFWEFSWHEIGVLDLPATIDYILAKTKQRNLHYVGHSQGTTVFLVWLSTYPRESLKIKTSHLLAPVGFTNHSPALFVRILAAIFGHPSPRINSIGLNEVGSRSALYDSLPGLCNVGSSIRMLCSDLFFLITGSAHRFNRTLLPDMLSTYPTTSSLRQIIHFVQEYTSGYFRQYDYGKEKNIQVYSSDTPPNYKVDRIKTSSPINLYYGGNDILSSPIDVHRLAQLMGDVVELHYVQDYGHLDLLMAVDTKEVINDCVLAKMEKYEGNPLKGNPSCHLSSKYVSH